MAKRARQCGCNAVNGVAIGWMSTFADVIDNGGGLAEPEAVNLEERQLPEGRLPLALERWPPLRPTSTRGKS